VVHRDIGSGRLGTRLFSGPGARASCTRSASFAGSRHTAPANPPVTCCFHIRANRMDLCFEFGYAGDEARCRGAVERSTDEVQGFPLLFTWFHEAWT